MENSIEREILERRWFYRFALPGGRQTDLYIPPELELIHDTRRRMMFGVLDPLLSQTWPEVTCLDVACHEGYFTHHLAARGCKRVLGVDARADHVYSANLIRKAYGQTNVEYRQLNIFDINPNDFESFDVVLMFGLLYHLENPIGALRTVKALTRKVCLVETQIAPGLEGDIDWGSYQWSRQMHGSLAVIDEPDIDENPEAGLAGIALVPSVTALFWIMKRLGFTKCEAVAPPEDAHEQLACRKRMMIAGYVDG
ncbi:MAG: DUF1698 domain-containing protein [Desulfomonile tiedjei]|uniref:DUF1698 domain-containing protein n=1 Tax=Desulfomonile tiedjei TaxID=2358 RepID=A0A9D6V1H6_9BACT|nr:DUF1698 domain-containing protein [Desulfomonile tiedjei]